MLALFFANAAIAEVTGDRLFAGSFGVGIRAAGLCVLTRFGEAGDGG